MADNNRTGVSSHDIARQVIISGEKFEAAQTTVNEMEKLLHVSDVLDYATLCTLMSQMFRTVLDKRRDYWNHELKRSSILANNSFISSMEKRTMDASIKFDHEERGMYIRVSRKLVAPEVPADESGEASGRPVADQR